MWADLVMGPRGALEALRKLQSEGVVGHISIASNYPDDNAPAEATAKVNAVREPIPDDFWQEIEPLIQTWDVVAR